MEHIEIFLPSHKFVKNFQTLKSRVDIPLPSDDVMYQCSVCDIHFPISSNGIVFFQSKIKSDLNHELNTLIKELIEKQKEEKGCIHEDIKIDNQPANLFVSFEESDAFSIMNTIMLGSWKYEPILLFTTDIQKNNDFLAVFKNSNSLETYVDFIKWNFHTFLNIDQHSSEEEDDPVFYDETHSTLRLKGGGRKLHEKYNYSCLWCPQEVMKSDTKGRFKEYRTYLNHFKKIHFVEGIQMSEFEEKVDRNDPKWMCPNCKTYYSLGHSKNHRLNCQTSIASSSAMRDENNIQSNRREDNSGMHKRKPSHSPSPEGSHSTKMEKITNTFEKSCQTHFSGVTEECQTEETWVMQYSQNGQEVIMETKEEYAECVKQEKIKLEMNSAMDYHAKDKEENLRNEEEKPMVKFHFDVEDEIWEENSILEKEIKAERIESILNPPLECNRKNTFNKWWTKLPKNYFTDRGYKGPKIFRAEDTDEFIQKCLHRYREHELEKSRLDDLMLEAESDTAKERLFSIERDRPFLDKYEQFVRTYSKKDSQNIFIEEYDLLNKTSASNAKTGELYRNRIMEFFKFMAKRFDNFHLDWMTDYSGKIEKIGRNGQKTKELFLPTKDELKDFVKQFKYGGNTYIFHSQCFTTGYNILGNPAANCGLRIFGIKKLLLFLQQEIRDNEHELPGTITEKRKTRKGVVERLEQMDKTIVPDGTIKQISTASNKSHKQALLEQLKKIPGRNTDSIMDGVRQYINSEDFNNQKALLVELACQCERIPTVNQYVNSTDWLLEMLVCIGGNRPCALLGVTLKEWSERRPGYCPFNQSEENEMVIEDPKYDNRKVLKDPYKRPIGCSDTEPTGVIVTSETDKVFTGLPCKIWFPNALADLVNDHALLAQKVLPKSVDLYHPNTRLFLNSKGNEITKIKCKHLKNYTNLPMVAYDFRRSLSTFCFNSPDERIRSAEPSILRHKESTGFAYYYQKHGENVEYVSIQYAMKNNLVKANTEAVDDYCKKLRESAKETESELSQKRMDKAIEFDIFISSKRDKGLNDAKQKGGRNWILPNEYNSFIKGIEEAISSEEERRRLGLSSGPFSNLLNYKIGEKDAGVFPPLSIWKADMYRVLYGLDGNIGDEMRRAELTVYDGVPFSTGLSGRKKIIANSQGKGSMDKDTIVAKYWHEKIKSDSRQKFEGKWDPLRFIFTEQQFEYQEHIKGRNEPLTSSN